MVTFQPIIKSNILYFIILWLKSQEGGLCHNNWHEKFHSTVHTKSQGGCYHLFDSTPLHCCLGMTSQGCIFHTWQCIVWHQFKIFIPMMNYNHNVVAISRYKRQRRNWRMWIHKIVNTHRTESIYYTLWPQIVRNSLISDGCHKSLFI